MIASGRHKVSSYVRSLDALVGFTMSHMVRVHLNKRHIVRRSMWFSATHSAG